MSIPAYMSTASPFKPLSTDGPQWEMKPNIRRRRHLHGAIQQRARQLHPPPRIQRLLGVSSWNNTRSTNRIFKRLSTLRDGF
ncbi:hypothetical protein EMPG_17186 [Blastomyces silverae]|uniref:Uncharacterized protein n=1 Tax=Blastomyces silverae TaxID=2060906 RepID=A0A0H1BDS5_9EURO|nr:hypothetical protein EMPG_17186 [Blastomyces silverae]